ncbi:T9SS type B sorting domain-containing protein [Flavobacterium zepuense]|uniref:T9SS type B sorting domain-containing protein n=1 Tax=Flavobacterium zepuense TaxID=2593302 RepID=A0A552UW51_9FLAO|nr:choice-of-anchor L domain-containing protein [Flavobacterium zepuense]TRW22435.1 T9SS type B sorting domain-containing protein [Flavobacterium zepuense]
MKKTTFLFFMFFLSLCAFAQPGLPMEGFEGTWTTQTGSGAGGPAGWALVSEANGPTEWWIQGNGGSAQPAFEGTHSAFLDRENVAPTTFATDWLITPLIEMPANPQLHFYSRLFFNADQNTTFKIYVSNPVAEADDSVANQTNTANFGTPQVTWTELQLNPTQLAWQQKTVDLPATMAGSFRYIAFVMAGDNGERWAIDNVSVTAKCFDPTTLTATNIGMTTANLSWANPSGATSWEIELLPQTGTPTGNGVVYNGTLPYVAGAPANGAPLTANTDYKYYVKALCSDGGESGWVGPFSFSTVALGESCAAPIVISTLPYSTTDNTSNYADNYEGVPGSTGCGTETWESYLNGNDVVYSYTATFTGVISINAPTINGEAGVFVYDDCADIGVSCIGGANSEWNQTSLSIPTLSVTQGQTYYIVVSTVWAQTTPYTLIIQQVNCAPPVGLPTTNIGQTSADLSWTNPSNATSWQIVIQAPAGGIPSGAGTTVTDNSNLTVTETFAGVDLVAATPYEYYVRADCGNGTFSAWAGPYVFNTMICETTNQCTYTFTLTDSWGDGWNGNTMTVSQNGITIATLGGTFTSGSGPITVPVQVCNDLPIQLYWNTGGSFANEVGVSIQNSFAQTFYTKAPGTGVQNSVLYTGTVDCDTAMCLAPTGLNVTNVTNTSADLGWAGQPTGTWEYYYAEAGSPAPTDADAIPTTTNPTTVVLEEATNYVFYVRMVCSDTQNSPWAGPFAFSSDVCPEAQQCDYTFVLTSDFWGGWYGGTMQITQNGINVATIGSTFTTGATQTVTVPLCTSTPFQVFWTNGGTFSYQVGLQIINGFDQTLFTMLPGTGTPNTVLYSSTADCLVPACLAPTGLYTENETTTTADLGWDGPETGSWEYYVVEAGEAAPTETTTPTGATITNPAVGVGPLTAATNYEYYVRIVCADDEESDWAGPFAFNTEVCEEADKCVFSFEMTSENGWGYEGNTMTISQGGVPVATIGDEFTWGSPNMYSMTVDIPLCADVPIEIFWNTTGWDAYEKGLIVYSPFMEDIFTKPAGTGAQGTTIYEGAPSCLAPLCPKPQDLTIDNIGLDTAEIGWTEMGSATQWEVTVLAYQATAPSPTAPIVTTLLTNDNPVNLSDYFDLESGTTYSFYVRAICGGDNGNSTWSGPLTFTTSLANDDCDGAIEVPVNPGAMCVQSVAGTITGSTSSGVLPSCYWDTPDYDAWFVFEATGESHAVNINNDFGATMVFAVFEGDDCGNLTEIGCTTWQQTVVLNDLTPGSNYYVMVYTTFLNNPATVTGFDICISTPEPPITVSETQYTVPELITDVFLGSDCAYVDNFTSVTGTAVGKNGIGYWESNGSSFQFSDPDGTVYDSGIVLVSGDAETDVPGPNDSGIFGGWENPVEEAALEAILNTYPEFPAGNQANTHGSTSIKFDFSPLVDIPEGSTLFKFLFASEEYGTPGFECTYSDVFAFILTDLESGEVSNLAVLPNGQLILVTNIHPDNQDQGANCPGINEEYFGQYNGLLSPINLNGQTIKMDAVVPYTLEANHEYSMQMIVANEGDDGVSSAVFLLGGSFNLGEIDLGADMIVEDGTGACAQEEVVLSTNLDPDQHTFTWFQDGVEMDGEDEATLTVTESGTYSVEAAVIGIDCTREGSILVEFFAPVEEIVADPADLTVCDADGFAEFDLTQNTDILLEGLDASLYTVTYYLTEADAVAAENAIETPEAFTNTISGGQPIWVNVLITASEGGCTGVKSFDLIVQDLTPVYTITDDFTLCEGATGTIEVTVENAGSDITYSWSVVGGADLPDTGSSITVDASGEYQVVVSNSGCTITASTVVTVVPVPVADDPADVEACGSYELPVLTNPGNAYYTQTSGGGTELAAGEVITSTQDIYVYASAGAAGCTAENVFTVTINATPAIVAAEVEPVTACESYTLPALTVGNYYDAAGGAGNVIPVGTEFTTNTTVYVYAETGSVPNCTSEESFTITIVPVPVADDPADVVECGSYTLPALTPGNAYYTETNGGGIELAAGEVITATQDVYVFASNGAAGCTDENVFTVTINATPAIVASEVEPVTACDSYILPALTVGNYYTAAGGAGTLIPAGTELIATTTVYVYAETGTVPNCTSETNFTVTVSPTPAVVELDDVATCDSYTLEALPAGNVYYTGPGATGTTLAAGTVIIDSQTIYVYAAATGNSTCFGETSFNVGIVATPEVTIDQKCNDDNEYQLTVIFADEIYNADNATFTWSGPQTGTGYAFVIDKIGTYTVTVTPLDGACPFETSVDVLATSCEIQKGISPNGDGKNDNFDLSGLDVRKIEIFNRYGKEVYSKTDYVDEWYGQTSGGDELPTGTYFYMVQRRNGESTTGWVYINRQDN